MTTAVYHSRAQTVSDPTLKEFGALMRKYRERRAMELEELAAKLNVSVATLQGWENGLKPPSLLRAFEWCRLLGVDLWPCLPGEY